MGRRGDGPGGWERRGGAIGVGRRGKRRGRRGGGRVKWITIHNTWRRIRESRGNDDGGSFFEVDLFGEFHVLDEGSIEESLAYIDSVSKQFFGKNNLKKKILFWIFFSFGAHISTAVKCSTSSM